MSHSPYEIALLIILLILITLIMKFYSSCSNIFFKRLSRFFFGFSSGILTLYPTIYIMSNFGGIININIFTISFAGTLGLPGTILLAITSIL